MMNHMAMHFLCAWTCMVTSCVEKVITSECMVNGRGDKDINMLLFKLVSPSQLVRYKQGRLPIICYALSHENSLGQLILLTLTAQV